MCLVYTAAAVIWCLQVTVSPRPVLLSPARTHESQQLSMAAQCVICVLQVVRLWAAVQFARAGMDSSCNVIVLSASIDCVCSIIRLAAQSTNQGSVACKLCCEHSLYGRSTLCKTSCYVLVAETFCHGTQRALCS
ncbi:hypothetical protein ABBQ32_001796 [Trebouxia sp. C0010 RCD-2024]